MKLPRDLLGTMTPELLLEMRVALVEYVERNLTGSAAHGELEPSIHMLQMAESITAELHNRGTKE